jgi:hypothetical protein
MPDMAPHQTSPAIAAGLVDAEIVAALIDYPFVNVTSHVVNTKVTDTIL